MRATRWIAVANALLASAAAADPRCKPSVTVRGEVAAAVAPLLRARGIEVLAPATASAFVANGCRRVHAEVARMGGQIIVAVSDEDGRRTQRIAEDAAAAATVIESWARGDLVDPLLAARGVIAPASEPAVRARVPSPPQARPRFLVAAGGDIGVSDDGAVWTSPRVQMCGRIGAFCAGGVARFAYDLERSGDTAELETARYAISLTAIGERPIRRGRLVISPGVGVGLSSVTATLAAEDEVEQASAFHVRAAIAGAVEVAHAWSLRVDLAAELAPLARERLGDADGIDRQLAASPLVQTWLGIVVAYGGP